MDHAVTVGDVVKFVLISGGIVGFIALGLAVLAAIANAFSR